MTAAAPVRRWPLILIASPAAVAIWSGWVGLGGLCGFGPIHPLPGIADGVVINTAITLPIGVEAYGAYALRAWLTPGVPDQAQRFARRSAIGALGLGMLGQVVYHLLAASGAARAPWPVVVLVACLPVATLGFGAALTHLLRIPVPETGPDPEISPDPGPGPRPEPRPKPEPGPEPGPELELAAAGLNGHAHAAAELFAADLQAGRVPAIRAIRSGLHVGQDKASQVQQYLRGLISTPVVPGPGPALQDSTRGQLTEMR